ncbi:MAG: GTP-binding protein, partial [Coleofasciculus sp. S288]|nr:GTP-binding protein [Coleofasciculus sp. S288]
MQVRTPLTVITGALGSGKTTLLRHILNTFPKKIAILMNEFGEIAIDTKIIQGKNVQMADLGGGCVCCSLLGEFEAAVNEIIDTVDPDMIVVETTGVAEPDALVFDIQESLTTVRLDGVVTVVDADAMVKYPRTGHTTQLQIEAADVILLN